MLEEVEGTESWIQLIHSNILLFIPHIFKTFYFNTWPRICLGRKKLPYNDIKWQYSILVKINAVKADCLFKFSFYCVTAREVMEGTHQFCQIESCLELVDSNSECVYGRNSSKDWCVEDQQRVGHALNVGSALHWLKAETEVGRGS